MLDVTLEQIEAVLGEKGRKVGRDYVFQCKVCMDKGKNNLIFSPDKGLLKCFSCNDNEGGQYVLDMINKISGKKPIKKETTVETTKVVIPQWKYNQTKYVEYMLNCNDFLLKNEELLNYVYEKRGLNTKTLELVGWGFDKEKNCFVIPIFSLKNNCIVDFELREKGEKKKIRRVGGGNSTIAQIYGAVNKKVKTAYITEGMIDGAVLLQWLREKGQKDFVIYSCSNGVSSLFGCLNEICFANFNEVKLILDNDEEGNKQTAKIIEAYPFIQDKREFLKNKKVNDICDYYKKYVLKFDKV